LTNCEYVAFDKDGAVTFMVNKAKNQAYNSKYTIFLMNDTGKYNFLDEWVVAGGKLRFP
jgi:hypothetical protein